MMTSIAAFLRAHSMLRIAMYDPPMPLSEIMTKELLSTPVHYRELIVRFVGLDQQHQMVVLSLEFEGDKVQVALFERRYAELDQQRILDLADQAFNSIEEIEV